jgi:hypothetical protein
MRQLLLRRAGLLLVAAIFPLASSMTGTAVAASTCGAQQLTVIPPQSNVFYIDAAVSAVECEGSTESLDTTTSNLALGRRRAASVCEILTRGLDIASVRTTTGESRPPATNHTPTGRQLNRRTDIRLHY